MNKTQIEWVQNSDGSPGFTWNPITGCLNGCEYCYARRLANTRLFKHYTSNPNTAPVFSDGKGISTDLADTMDPFYPRFWPGKLEQPLKRTKPAGIFTCDMSDLFGIGIPEQWTWSVLNFIERCPQHRFYLLTKQPQNLAKFSPFPDNCWVGVSATDASMFTRAWAGLKGIQASVKFVSMEPLLKWDMSTKDTEFTLQTAGINWAIIGAQTKPTIMPKIEWVREIVEACDKAGVPVFLKDSLIPLLHKPENLDWLPNYRQEMPHEK